MSWRIDHIFVCVREGGPEAAAFRDAGLVEGEPNTHRGQGTANRRFFFENGFLELLWVTDESEARSELTAPTRIWERWAGRHADANPFGICLSSPTGAVRELPFPTWAYTPEYLPEGRAILFADGQPLGEPELFVIGWPHRPAVQDQPVDHPLGLRRIRSVSVGLANPSGISDALHTACDAGLVALHRADAPECVVRFTSTRPAEVELPSLRLTLIGNAVEAP